MSRLIAAAGPESDKIVLREIGGTWSLPDSGKSKLSASGR
jgi:hypothetical protein